MDKPKSQLSIKAQNISSTLLKGKGRISLILIGLTIVLTLAWAVHNMISATKRAAPQRVGQVNLPAPRNLKHDDTVESTTEGKARLDAEHTAAAQAAAAGRPYLAEPVIAAQPPEPKWPGREPAAATNVDVTRSPGERGRNTGGAQQNQPLPQQIYILKDPETGHETKMTEAEYREYQNHLQQTYNENRNAVFDPQIKSLESMSTTANSDYATVSFALPDRTQVPASPPGPSPSGAGSTPAGARLVMGGEGFYAELTIGVNTDEGANEVVAKVLDGRLKGAKLVGTVNQGAADISFHFNRMFLPSVEQPFAINAISINIDTMDRAMSDDVNRHWFERYGSLFVGSVLTGIGNAAKMAATAGTEQIVTQGGQVVTITPPITTQQQVRIAAGSVGSAIGTEIQNRTQNIPDTYKAYANKEIGVVFLDNVYEPSTAAQAASK